MEIKISIQQLEALLDQQKELVIESLLNNTSYYNEASTPGNFYRGMNNINNSI